MFIVAQSQSRPVVSKKQYNIGLLIVATGPYLKYAQTLIKSADQYFCQNHKVTYFVFTDGDLQETKAIKKVAQKRLGWPYDTMMRFFMYDAQKEKFANMDYLFSCDADMLFVDNVGDEILSDRVATRHPHLIHHRGIYETSPLSTAAVSRHEGQYYFAGAFYGGTRDEFFKLTQTIKTNIDIDCARGVRAWVNDESHLNRYFIDNKPTLVLGPEYCHFETWKSPFKPKLIARDADDHLKVTMRIQATLNPLEYFRKMRLSEKL